MAILALYNNKNTLESSSGFHMGRRVKWIAYTTKYCSQPS